MVSKVTTQGAPSGNWTTPMTCTNSACGKTTYARDGDTANAYKCKHCGHTAV